MTSRASTTSTAPTRSQRLGQAVEATAILLAVLYFGGLGILAIGFGVMLLIVAPVLLIPIGMLVAVVAFFYFFLRPKQQRP